jgi:hypothetical protein
MCPYPTGVAGKWLPVAFGSRKLKEVEVRYTTTENRCLEVVFELRKYRQLLYGNISRCPRIIRR